MYGTHRFVEKDIATKGKVMMKMKSMNAPNLSSVGHWERRHQPMVGWEWRTLHPWYIGQTILLRFNCVLPKQNITCILTTLYINVSTTFLCTFQAPYCWENGEQEDNTCERIQLSSNKLLHVIWNGQMAIQFYFHQAHKREKETELGDIQF